MGLPLLAAVLFKKWAMDQKIWTHLLNNAGHCILRHIRAAYNRTIEKVLFFYYNQRSNILQPNL